MSGVRACFVLSLFMFGVILNMMAVMIISHTTLTEAAMAQQHRKQQHTVKVCQNKNCMKQFKAGNLLETFNNLIPPESAADFSIESSGCLSRCGEGPNIEAKSSSDRKTTMFVGIDSPDAAATVLESRYSLSSPAMLVAACDVMAQANQFTSFTKKNTYLSSVITSLSNDPALDTSNALVSALLLRADARLVELDITAAIQDCLTATQIDPNNGKAWRQLAEAYEISGDTIGALEAVTKWAQTEQVFVTKAQREVSRLRSKLSR